MGIGSIGILEDVFPEDYLDLANGVRIRNLLELIKVLKKMKPDVFRLHVTKSRNDFAEWILEAYNDERLAKRILRNTDKLKIINILESYLRDAKKVKPFERDMKIRSPVNKKSVLKEIGEVGNEM